VNTRRVILYVMAVNAESVRTAGCQISWEYDVATCRVDEICISLTTRASVFRVAMEKDTYAPAIDLIQFEAMAGKIYRSYLSFGLEPAFSQYCRRSRYS
jgi:hypothetical protein